MTDRSQLRREEAAYYMEHPVDFKKFTLRMREAWSASLLGAKEPPKDVREGLSELYEGIGRNKDLLKLYLAVGIYLGTETAVANGVPDEEAERIKRETFVDLAGASTSEEAVQIALAVEKQLEQSYQRYGMQGYSWMTRQAIEEIHRHRYGEIRVQQIAAQLHVGRSHLSDVFHRETGKTMAQYIRQVKMQTAAELFRGHLYSIQEIAELLGYRSTSHFSSTFRAYYGMSPSEYMTKGTDTTDPP